MKQPAYLDYNATTPLDAGVLDAMLPFLQGYSGNPSSIHELGRQARAALDDCRYRVASLLQAKPSEIIFTSGGTESNNLAIQSVARSLRGRGRHLVTSAVEHHAVLHCFESLARDEGFELSIVPVDSDGVVNPEDVAAAIRGDTILVSIMAANNEVGAIQPIQDVSLVCRDKGVLLHSDAVQAFGKLPLESIVPFQADLISLCAHKFHGPKGAGILFAKSPLRLSPILKGGAQENESRPGTENLPSIVGLTTALERFASKPVFESSVLTPLSERLISELTLLPGVTFRGPRSPLQRLPNTVAFTFEGWDSISLLAALDLEGVFASSGSACSVGSLEPSHVLLAMGCDHKQANSLVRFSLGRDTTLEDIDLAISACRRILGCE